MEKRKRKFVKNNVIKFNRKIVKKFKLVVILNKFVMIILFSKKVMNKIFVKIKFCMMLFFNVV